MKPIPEFVGQPEQDRSHQGGLVRTNLIKYFVSQVILYTSR